MKIAMLLSGGVDSSLALTLLKEQGHDITAFYLKIWLEDELAFLGECPWEEDLAYAQQVCAQLGVPLKVISLQREYHQRVVSYTIAELKAGRTPSPDLFCNKRIKFGVFFDHIDDSYDKVASGHYARTAQSNGCYWLRQGVDSVKDQTYFLAHLNQQQISRILFPIGELQKSQVRQLAEEKNLPNQARKDSQGICFLGKIKYNDFVRHHLGEKPGPIVAIESGQQLGSHKGYWYHTIGQRKGLGLSGGPWYVVKKDIANNTIYVGKNFELEDQAREQFEVCELNWIAGKPRGENLRLKLRHGPEIQDCRLELLEGNRGKVTLAQKDQGVAPGQFAVFYEQDHCLGCGRIVSQAEEKAFKAAL